MARVSIVMPVYNGAAWLPTCLDDVLAQTMGDFELIVVDDASSDETPRILADYATRDTRLKVLTHASNLYAGVSRNDGMDVATGEYLLFLDADDRFEPALLQTVVARADASSADVVLFGADELDSASGQRRPNRFFLNADALPSQRPFCAAGAAQTIFQVCTPEPWTKLFRRSFVEGEGLRFQDLSNTNDLYFSVMALAKARCIDVCDETLTHHRVGTGSSIQDRKSSQPLAFLDALRAVRGELEAADLLPALRVSFANLALFHCLYNSGAPADWSRVFDEMGVTGLRRSEFYYDGDFERCVGMLLEAKAESGDATPVHENEAAGGSAGFWEDVALYYYERALRAEAELGRVMDSASFKIGRSITSLPRSVRSALKGE